MFGIFSNIIGNFSDAPQLKNGLWTIDRGTYINILMMLGIKIYFKHVDNMELIG